jgi:hypothetical protein
MENISPLPTAYEWTILIDFQAPSPLGWQHIMFVFGTIQQRELAMLLESNTLKLNQPRGGHWK